MLYRDTSRAGCIRALENGADLYVNERQKIRHYRVRSTEERRRMPNRNFYFAQCVCKIALYNDVMYTNLIGNQP